MAHASPTPVEAAPPGLMPSLLEFTHQAAAKVAELIEEEGNPDLKLRVFVQGGGCSGFQYGFTFDEAVNDDDTQMQKNGVTLLIDSMSLQYLMGAEIDYKEDLQGAQFVIKNPNATTTCGRVEATQEPQTRGSRDGRQIARPFCFEAHRQPGEGRRLDLIHGQAARGAADGFDLLLGQRGGRVGVQLALDLRGPGGPEVDGPRRPALQQRADGHGRQ
eukprot:gene6227-7739_t